MSKKSPAKLKMLQAQIQREAAARKADKARTHVAEPNSNDQELERYASQDSYWRSLGLAAPACRALVDDGLFELADLRKVSLAAIKELDGINSNAVRMLVDEMKKFDLAFRK